MDTQHCGTCGEAKPIEEFNFRNRLTGKRHTCCKSCQKNFKRAFYDRNLQSYKVKSAQQKTRAIQRNQEHVREYLNEHPCVDCGESDALVLEFDHLHDKDRGIAQLSVDGVSWNNILREIQKCQVRCANCHRKKTARQFGWYRKLGL